MDYGEEDYDPNHCNVGLDDKTGSIQMEIRGLAQPKSKEAERICREDLNEIVTAFVQDRRTVERGLFDEELVPQEITQLQMGKIIRDKFPELDLDDQEAVRQHAITALSMIQQGKKIITDNGADPGKNMALINGICRFAVDVRELSVDLIDSINPFSEAYAILAKTMSEDRLKQVAAIIAAK